LTITKDHRRENDIGTLTIHNDSGASLSLQRIQHFGKKDDKPEIIKLDRAETYIEGPALSISVEKLPPVSVQKFPHGLVGYSVFNPDFLCLNR